jgi:hypothetical protein
MAEPYRLPTVAILDSVASDEVATITLDLSREDYLSYPIAPANLLSSDADLQRPETFACLFELHQLIAREGTRLVFETYVPAQALPVVGATYAFCSWWTHWAMDAVRDLSANWQQSTYPDDGSHEHCPLTWETISSYTGDREGYRSQHGWITIAGYRDYIERDRLRIRSHWRSCENRPSHLYRIDE